MLAIEVLTAARGIDMRAPLAPAPGDRRRSGLRTRVAGPGADRHLPPEIEAVLNFARTGSLVAAAESVTGPLV